MAVSTTSLFGGPPPGIDLTANKSVSDDAVVAVLAFLATMAVMLRFIIRRREQGSLQGDDWLILVALIGEYGTAACTFTGNYFGAGKHVWATEPSSLRKMSIALFVYPWIYVVATVGLKLSFCWTYMRIFTIGNLRSTLRCKTWLDKSLMFCVVASLLYALSVWLPMTVACQPLSFFWNQYAGETDGKCMDYLLMWIVTGIISAILDLLILLIPVPAIYSLQMTWQKKLGVVAVLALGSFVIVAATIRLVYMAQMIGATDITWALGPAQIWTALEPSLGIVSACLITTFRPVVNGIRHFLRLGRVGETSELAGDTETAISASHMNSKARKRTTGHRAIEEEEDEIALVVLDGKHKAKVIVSSAHMPLSHIPAHNIQVDRSFSVNGSSSSES